MNFNTKIASLGFGCALAMASTQADAQTITQWNFGTSVVAAPDNSPAPTTGTGTAISLGMTNQDTYAGTTATNSVTSDDVTSTPGTANSTFVESTWRIRGKYAATGVAPNSGTPSGSANVNGWNLSAAQYSQGAEFDVSTAGYSNIQFSFDWYCTTQGIRDLQVQYNTNVSNTAGWTNVGGTSSTGTYIATPNDFYNAPGSPAITLNLSSISALNNDPTAGFRLVSAYDSTGNLGSTYAGATLTSGGVTQIYNNNSGNWRFDNITVASVPEPSSWALALIVGGAFAFLRRRMLRKI